MPLRDFPIRPMIAVSDIRRAADFYEHQLGLPLVRSGASAKIADGGRLYACAGEPAVSVYQTSAAGTTRATVATWFVEDLDQVVDELSSRGVGFVRYDAFEHDARGITPRAGGGRIAWFEDPDGNTFALEADD